MSALYNWPAVARRCLPALGGLLMTLTAAAQAPDWDGAYPGSLSTVPDNSVISAVATDAQGNVFVTGNFSRTVIFGNTTLVAANGSQELFVAKFEPRSSTWVWAVRGGGTNGDSGNGIAVSGSSVYVTGSIYNNASNANNVTFDSGNPATGPVSVAGASSAIGADLVLVKYTDNGSSATLNWTQTGGGLSGDRGVGVAVSGNSVYVLCSFLNDRANSLSVVLGGTGLAPGTTVVRGASATVSADWLLAKYGDYGAFATLDWTQVAGGSEGDYCTGVAASGGSVYVVGTMGNTRANASAVTFGAGGDGSAPGGLYPQAGVSGGLSSGDLVLAKYTDNGPTGSFRWSQVGGGTENDYGYGVAVSGSSVYVAGAFINNAANAAGVLLGGSGLAVGTAAVSGASATVSSDVVLLKYQDDGATGSYQWSQVGGGTDTDLGRAVAVRGNRVYVAGQLHNSAGNGNAVVFGPPGTPTPLPGLGGTANDDLLLACYTDNGTSGTYNWARLGGGEQYDYAFGVAVSGQQVYAGGSVKPPATFGPVTVATTNGYPLNVLARLTDPALAPLPVQAGPAAAKLALYPNPTRATALLTGAPAGAPVRVLDVLGRAVVTATADATGRASLPPLPAGLYLVQAGSATARLHVE